jgi:hypothetical protein
MRNVSDGKRLDPRVNRFIREPGHIEYAGKLGLGVFDPIHVTDLEL